MGFCIYHNLIRYSAIEFLAFKSDLPLVLETQLLLNNWQQNKPFTFYSSGSTGEPKAYSFEKEQLVISAEASIKALGLRYQNEHVLLCLNPKFVGGAMMLIRALILDCPITIMEPQWTVFDSISEKHLFTFASFVPVQLLHTNFSISKFNRFRIVLIGGTFMPQKLIQQLSEISNRSYHTYGMTETLSHIALKELNKEMGYRTIHPHKIRINEEGCVCVSSRLLKEELVTHDLAVMINEDQFQILGRTDFMINSGGLKINPEQIEAFISGIEPFPLQKQFAISRVKDAIFGEQVVLVLEEKFEVSDFEKLVLNLQKLGLKKEVPRQFRVIEAIPINKNGKIDRRKIIEYIDNQQVLY